MINRNRNRMRFWSIVLSACLLVELLPVSAFGAGESWENAAVAWVPQEQTQDGARAVQLTADLNNLEDGSYSAAMVEITLSQDEAAALQTQGLETVEESELTEPHEEESPPTTEAPPEETTTPPVKETTTPTEEETVKTSPTPVEELSADSAGASGAMTDLGMSSTEIVAATDAPVPDPAPMPANSLENIPDTQESPTGDGEQDPSSEPSPDEPKEGPDSGDPSAPHALLIETANGAVLRILLDEENPEFSEPSLTFVTSDADLLVDVSEDEDEDDIKVFGFIEDSAPYIYSTFDTRGGQEVTAEIYTEPMLVYRSMNPLVRVSADQAELELNGKNTDITYTIELSVREEDQTYAVNLTIPEGLSFPADSWSYQLGDSGAASGVILCGDTELLSLIGLPERAVIGEPSAVGQNLQFTLTIPGIKESLWDRLGDLITGVQDGYKVSTVLHTDAFTRAASGINGEIAFSVGLEGDEEAAQTVETTVTAGDILAILKGAEVVRSKPFTQAVQWADNNSTSRPAYGTEFYPQMYFRISDGDGTTQWIELTANMLNYFGFNGTWPTITGTAGGFTIDLPNQINAGTEYADEFYDVEWSFAPPETPEGYVFYQRENKDTWYYIQSTEFRAALNTRWGNHEPTEEQLLAVLEQFTLHWSYGTTSDTQTLSNLIEEGYAKVVETVGGGWELVISDMWAYSVDDDPITFYIQESEDDPDKTITADELNGALGTVLDEGDHLTIDYNNTGVPNVGDNTDAVYSGGALNLSRVGETTYSATKVWVDTEENRRPELTFDLWRYQAGKDPSTAAQVLDSNDQFITFTPDSNDVTDNKITISFDETYSLPKYDPDGYEYIYVVREYMEMDDGDNSYEQVFGTIVTDKETGTESVTGDFIMVYDEGKADVVEKYDRPDGNTYVLDLNSGDYSWDDDDKPNSESDYARYALREDGTFINQLAANITISGEKIWESLPGHFLERGTLPSIRLDVSRSVGDTPDPGNPVATLTITSKQWEALHTPSGAYQYLIQYEGENRLEIVDGELTCVYVPETGEAEDKQGTLLPRYDEDGALYTYTVDETILFEGASDGEDGTGGDPATSTDGDTTAAGEPGGEETSAPADDVVFDKNTTNGFRVVNTYNPATGSLTVKKHLYLLEDPEGFPAITFRVTQYAKYAEADQYTATGLTWTETLSADKVEELYRVYFPEEPGDGGTDSGEAEAPKYPGYVTDTVTFDNLPLYAPDGTEYIYSVEEVKTYLAGYDTWAKEGNVEYDGFTDADKKTVIGNLKPVTVSEEPQSAQATFLNKYNEATVTELTATKTWDDLNNADGFRPKTADFANLLTLTRSADTQPGKENGIDPQEIEFTIESPAEWINSSGTFTIKPADENSEGFEVYAPNGMPWKYTLAEPLTGDGTLQLVAVETRTGDEVKNHIYSPTNGTGKWNTLKLTETATDFGTVTNSITTNAFFDKVWADEEGNKLTEDYLDFPLSVTFQLQISSRQAGENDWSEWSPASASTYQSVQEALALPQNGENGTKTLTGYVTDDVWKNGSFTGLPSVIKVEDADGAAGQYIFLKYRVVETAVSYGEAAHQTELTVTLDDDGITYLYGLDSEDTVIAGGSLYHNPTANRSTSTNRLSTLSVTARKVWQDSENLYDTRPGGDDVMTWKSWFVLQRQAEGETTWENVAVFELYGRDSADGTGAQNDERWEYTISDLPRVDEQNRTYEYRIRELQPREDGYESATDDEISAAVVEENGLYNTESNTYTTTYNNKPENDWTVTNTLDNPTEASEIRAVKEWAVPDGALTPTSVIFELQYRTGDGDWQRAPYANAVQTVGADDDWTATWENLPRTIYGETVQYQVVERDLADGWIQTDCTDATENGIRSITFYNAPMMSFSVLKKWVPGDGEHPAVTVALYRTTEREEIGRDIAANRVGDVVLSEASNWTHTFSPLPQYDAAAQRYYYYALELDSSGSAVEDNGGLTMDDSKEYIATYDFGGTPSSTTTITNTSAVTLTGTKRWTAADRPDITLIIQRKTDSQTDWEAVTEFAPVWNRSGDTWTFTYPYLPAVDPDGNAYTYRVQEEPLSGYDTVYTTDDDGWLVAGGDQSFGEIHNIQRGGLQVTKTVSGNTGETDREFHFTVTLSGTSLSGAAIGTAYPYTYVRQDGTTVQGSLTFTDGTAAFTLKDRESLTLTGIPAGITYQVTETEANQDGYTTTAGDGTTGAIPAGGAAIAAFHNHRSSSGSWGDDDPTTSVTGTKTWVDNGNAQGTRPGSLRLTLYRSVSGGAETVVSGVSPAWVKNGDVWTYTFSNLPLRDSAGRLYRYRVEETVPEGYTSSVSGYHFTNTLTTEDETTSVSGRKYWRGDTAETRPDSIVVVLYANGQEVARQVVSAGQDWSYLFEELPKYDAQGSEITYTVREETVPEGYRVEYSGTDIINLSLDQDFSALRITKTVSGPGSDTEQAFHFTVTLSDTSINGTYGDLTFVNGVAEFSLRHGEEKTAAGLPAGIAYMVTEAEANQNGYTTTAAGDTGTLVKDQVSSAEFTNTKPEDPPEPTPTPDPGTPQTGDPSLTWLWAILCAASLCGFLALLALNQKKRNYRGKRIRK